MTKSMQERLGFDLVTDQRDRLLWMTMAQLATMGHGDWPQCGVASFNLFDLAEALSEPPGKLLRSLKAITELAGGICVEQDGAVLYAMPWAEKAGFEHLYKREGFEGYPPTMISRKA